MTRSGFQFPPPCCQLTDRGISQNHMYDLIIPTLYASFPIALEKLAHLKPIIACDWPQNPFWTQHCIFITFLVASYTLLLIPVALSFGNFCMPHSLLSTLCATLSRFYYLSFRCYHPRNHFPLENLWLIHFEYPMTCFPSRCFQSILCIHH